MNSITAARTERRNKELHQGTEAGKKTQKGFETFNCGLKEHRDLHALFIIDNEQFGFDDFH
jgi:hypothetical protein